MRLVLIEWEDSYGCAPSWEPLDGLAAETLMCRSVGWLAKDSDGVMVVVPHRADGPSPPGQGCGDMTIPARAVVRVVDLEEVAKEAEWHPATCAHGVYHRMDCEECQPTTPPEADHGK